MFDSSRSTDSNNQSRKIALTMFTPNSHNMPTRRYDLDALRVLVFGLLILYHIGMMYVENWGFHLKSSYLSQPLESVMLLVEPWRMASLWIISGIAIRFILAKVSLWQFVSMRSLRLLLPLAFGLLVIIPPQLYYEMTFNGEIAMSYWQFYQAFFDLNHPMFANHTAGVLPHIDVNHLWYLRELWLYSLYLIPLLPLLNSKLVSRLTDWVVSRHAVIAIVLAVLPLAIIQSTVAFDQTRYPLGFTFLLYGYLLGWHPVFWQRLKANSGKLAITALSCYLLLAYSYNTQWAAMDKTTVSLARESMFAVYSLSRILGVLTVLALAHRYLDRPSKRLSYLSEAVYSYYIVHQTIIIAAGYELSQLALGPIVEPILLIIVTTVGCFASYEIVRRIEWLRPFFGLKLRRSYGQKLQTAGFSLACLVVVPLGVQLL